MSQVSSIEKQLPFSGRCAIFSTILMNISNPCHSVRVVIEEHAQVRKLLVCLIVKGEDDTICGIEIKKMSRLLPVFEVAISALLHSQESVKVVRLKRQLAETVQSCFY